MKLKNSFLGIFLLFDWSGCSSKSKSIKEYTPPTRKLCEYNGGHFTRSNYYGSRKYGFTPSCNQLTVTEAKKSCSEMGMSLPTLNELLTVAKECGSQNALPVPNSNCVVRWKNTKSKTLYSQCYKEKGFRAKISYLTSTKTSDGSRVSFNFSYSPSMPIPYNELSIMPYKGWGSIYINKETEPSDDFVRCKANKHN